MATGLMSSIVPHLRRAALLDDGGGVTDGQLLESFLARRDEAAFAALVRRHGPMVLGVCRRVLRNPHDAEDAFQATFLVLVRKAASLRQPELVGNWLYGAAHRAALETKAAHASRRARERQVRQVPEREAHAATDVWQDWRPLLDRELDRLPDKYRVPVVLCELEGRKRKEVACQLGIPEGTLSSRLATARRMLARRLARAGLTLSGGAVAAALAPHAASAGVPGSLAISTVRAATAVAAGSTATGAVSTQVAALAEGVMKAMFVIQLRKALAFLLTVGILLGGGVAAYRAVAAGRAADQKDDAPKPADPAKQVGEVRRFEGHTDWVYTVALSRDGRRALSGSSSEDDGDTAVRLWDVSTGKELRRLDGHTKGVMGVAFAPDGKRAASAGDDNTVRLWDLETGKELKRFEGHTDQVWAVAFSPDGKRVVSGGRDNTIRLWDVAAGKDLKTLEGHTDAVRTVAFSPDGKRVLSGAFDGTVRLWDVENGNELRTLGGHTDGVQCVAFSRDGRRVLSCGLDRTVRLWDVKGGNKHCVFTGHTDAVTSVAFSPDGKRMLSCSWDQTVRLWDVESGEVLHSFAGHEAQVQSVVFSPDGRHALSGSRDKSLRLWRLPE
jgi:RNA polymerase sigma factor (sigma-70 family)